MSMLLRLRVEALKTAQDLGFEPKIVGRFWGTYNVNQQPCDFGDMSLNFASSQIGHQLCHNGQPCCPSTVAVNVSTLSNQHRF